MSGTRDPGARHPGVAPAIEEPLDADRQYVMRTVRERGVRFIRLWFVDVVGLPKSIAIPSTELDAALEEGVGLDGSALEGSARLAERDVIAHPDPRTFQLIPWRPLVGRMLCDVRLPDGAPFPGDSRHALARVLDQAADLGLTLQIGTELEFFLFADSDDFGQPPVPLDDGNYFDLTPMDDGSEFRRRTIEHLEQMGIPVNASHHEVAPSQHEIKLSHTDALTMADAVITFRLAVKEVAREMGVYATFMPKPLEDQSGSAMHVHISLFDGERNVFYDEDPARPLSPVGTAFLAGVLAHAPELTAVTNQWVNSYKRLAGGFEAPEHVSWTRHSRSALVRVPSARPGRERAARIELRSPDAACNPYLCFALVLAAGLRGLERGYQLAAEADGDNPRGARALPGDLHEAISLFEHSELVRETLGDRLCDWYVLNKRREWDAYRRTVTEFERRRYLRLL